MVTTTTGLATSFITFTRTSNATVTDSNGFIKWAGHNLLTHSESFDNAAWLASGTVIAAPTKVAANAVAAPNGTTTADEVSFPAVTGAGDVSILVQSFTNMPLVQHTAGIWVKAKAAGDIGKQIVLYSWTGVMAIKTHVTLDGTWQYVSASGTWTANNPNYAVGVIGSTYGGVNQGAVSVYLWGAHLYRSDLGGMVLNPARGDAYYPTTPRNLLGSTEDFSAAAWTKSNVTVASNAVVAPNGLQTADTVTATSNNGEIYQGISFVVGTSRTSSIWIRRRSGTGTISLYAATAPTDITSLVTNEWTRISITSSAGTSLIYSGIKFGTAGDAVDLWGAQLSDSASLDAYSPVYGAAVTSAAYYAPRLDFDPVTLAARGLLVEEQRTNLLTYSSEFNNAAWVDLTNATISATATTAPDGTSTVDKLVSANVTDNVNVGRNNVTLVSSKIYTVSVYLRADGARYVQITTNSTTSLSHANFDLDTGTATAGSNGGATITPAGDGWYRCSMTFTSLNTLGGPYFSLQDSGTAARGGTYTGNGTSGVFLYGAQLEIGASNADAPFPTSFIPTGAATATRTADVANVSTQAFPYSASEGTIVVNAQIKTWSAADSAVLAALDDGSTTDNFTALFYVANGNYRSIIRAANSDTFDQTGSAAVNNAAIKLATAYKTNDSQFAVNGTTNSTDTSVTLPNASAFNQMSIGRLVTSSYLNGHIRQITYIPRRLTSAELAARTV